MDIIKTVTEDILNEITLYCSNECCNTECCPEEDCILFRIEKIIVDKLMLGE